LETSTRNTKEAESKEENVWEEIFGSKKVSRRKRKERKRKLIARIIFFQ
jgi:rRNA processing protein Gar1